MSSARCANLNRPAPPPCSSKINDCPSLLRPFVGQVIGRIQRNVREDSCRGGRQARRQSGHYRPNRCSRRDFARRCHRRAKAYLAAGADWIFPEALAVPEEFERFSREIDAPLVANMTEFGQSPLFTLDELAEMGFAAVLYPVTMLRIAMRGVEAALALLADEGTQASLVDLMQTRQELYDLLGYADYEQRDENYFGGVVDRRMALAREWDELVEQVRALDGFEDFLKPPRLESLLPAAANGPVAIINVSRWRCDALLVHPGGVTAVPLEGLTLTDATDRANTYLDVLHTAELADLDHVRAQSPVPGEPPNQRAKRLLTADRALDAAHERVDTMLHDLQAWMWQTIAEPVLDALGFTVTPEGDPEDWPRLWWCPTGPLTLLPLHAAGDHRAATDREPRPTVLDRVVSSYTPTLRALIEACRPDDEQARGEDRLLLVDVPDAPGQIPLDTTRERAALLAAFPDDDRTVLDHETATRAAVRAALPEHRWVHFSCHGDQDLKDPSRGGLLLRDATLTVADVTEGHFHGDFAGLSACKTAVGGIDLPDEAITLAAALHYTGYRHVVAALWSVDNRTSSEIFARLYQMIAADGRLTPERSPAALHRVVCELRNRNPEWPHRWTPFAHTGP